MARGVANSEVMLLCVRCYIMSSLSYVALGLGDPVSALAYSLRLRAMSRVPGGLLYLTSLYSAQALVLLHRVPEALKLLTPDNIKDINFTGMARGVVTQVYF